MRPDRWRPETTRRFVLSLIGVVPAVIAPMSGTGTPAAAVAGAAGVILLVGAAARFR
jgi:hypothetical protein